MSAAVVDSLRDYVAGGRPYPAVELARHVQTVGKDGLDPAVLREVGRVRGWPGADELARAQADCLLDKSEGRYRYDSYLALPLLRVIIDGRADRQAVAAALVTDVVSFELAALHNDRGWLPIGRPSASVVQKRLNYAVRHLANHGMLEAADHPVDVRDRAACHRLLATLVSRIEPRLTELLPTAVQPVSTVHDEYMFIRVLQGYEIVFDTLVEHAVGMITALAAQDAVEATRRARYAAEALVRGNLLFSLVATMPPENFLAFRDQTEGSSAIQSAQYKRFESLCDRPQDTRLDSDAYRSVPRVRADVAAGQLTVSDAYLGLTSISTEDDAALRTALTQLDRAHHRWKAAHHKIAERMIATRTGSGGTSGSPYLKARLDSPLFPALEHANLIPFQH